MKRYIPLILVLCLLLSACASAFDTTISGEVKEKIIRSQIYGWDEQLGRERSEITADLMDYWEKRMDDQTNDIVYYYYGTFSDVIVWFAAQAKSEAMEFVLADSRFYFPASGKFWATKDDEQYSLEEAFEQGLLTAEDIALVAKRHESCNPAVLNADRPANTGDETGLSLFELNPEEAEAEAKRAHEAYWVSKNPNIDYAPYAVEFVRYENGKRVSGGEPYYGTFGDTVVWFSSGTADSIEDFNMAGSNFWYGSSCTFYACKDGTVYSMGEAYLLGYLNAADIAVIAQRHAEYTASFGG